jgi:TonB family protein
VGIVAGFKIMTIAAWKKITQHAGILISIAVHASILLAILLCSRATQPKLIYGSQQPVLTAYLTLPSTHTQQQVAPIKQALALTLQKQTSTPPNQTTVTAEQTIPTGKPMSALIALLHAAIAKHQQYPASAEEMERTGRVTLGFTLLTNGTINSLTVLRSSGTTSLDNAALAAVNEATPFPQVSRYQQAAHDYQIDVVFELG